MTYPEGRTRRRGLRFTVDHGGSLDGMRRDIGISLRRLSGLTGLPYPRLHRILRRDWPPRQAENAAIRRALTDEQRIRRSADPALLRHMIERAIPFLEARDGRSD